MPTFKCEPLETLARDIFCAIHVPPAGAAWMAKLLVRANLRGHDSHGMIRVPQYVTSWKKGEADPKAEPVVVQEGPATALVDGKRGFGQIVARRGMEVAMTKAAAIGVAAVGVHNSNHIG
ncbi:MAG TPA: Ldh family oxidoreductase, partial [Candidatus Methylomirabilis sp.]